MDPFSISHVNIYHWFSTLLKRKKGVVLVAVDFPEKREVFGGFEGCCRGKLKQACFSY